MKILEGPDQCLFQCPSKMGILEDDSTMGGNKDVTLTLPLPLRIPQLSFPERILGWTPHQLSSLGDQEIILASYPSASNSALK